jgi:hypothetical protein
MIKQYYDGGYSADSIVAWVNKKSGIASLELECEELGTKLFGSMTLVYFGDKNG